MNSKERVGGMGTRKMLPMIISMSIPAVCGNIVNALYNIVDRMFVGQFVSTDALGAIGLMFPLNNITAALTVMMSIGGGAMVSLSLGKGEYDKVNRIFTSLVTMSCCIAILIASSFFIFSDRLIRLCGADETSALYKPAVTYLRIIAVGQLFQIINLAMAAVIRAEGNTKYAMIVTMTGAAVNVGLDALLVIVIPMGVAGAAIATVISQMISFLLSLLYHKSGKGVARWMGWKRADTQIMREVVSLGLAPAVFQGLSFVNNMITNHSLMLYADAELGRGGGDLAISAVSVIQSVENLAIMFVMGMNNAISTIISYNYGLKSFHRVKQAALTGQAIAFGVSFLIWAAMMFAPEFLFRIFSGSDMELISYGASAMRKGKMLVMFLGFQTLASMYFSAIGRPKRATFISISRNGLFLIPALLILPAFLGLDGVLYSTSVSDACSVVLVSAVYIKGIRELDKKIQENSAPCQCAAKPEGGIL